MRFYLSIIERAYLLACIQQTLDKAVDRAASAPVGRIAPSLRADAIRRREELEKLKLKLAAGAPLTVDRERAS